MSWLARVAVGMLGVARLTKKAGRTGTKAIVWAREGHLDGDLRHSSEQAICLAVMGRSRTDRDGSIWMRG